MCQDGKQYSKLQCRNLLGNIRYSANKELQSHALLYILILSLMPNIFPGMKLIKDKKVKSEA
jgi:hypothetical protein